MLYGVGMDRDDRLTIRMKIAFGPDARLGPGKMELLAAIAETGSIAAAGRRLGMSYRRAWLLTDALNAMFAEPCVKTATGGSHGGGSVLTPFGRQLLAAYVQLVADTERLAAAAFRDLLRQAPARAG
jgi:molybdate transport system regulatory protein